MVEVGNSETLPRGPTSVPPTTGRRGGGERVLGGKGDRRVGRSRNVGREGTWGSRAGRGDQEGDEGTRRGRSGDRRGTRGVHSTPRRQGPVKKVTTRDPTGSKEGHLEHSRNFDGPRSEGLLSWVT